MSEQELKLNVPVHAQSRVEQAVTRAKFSEIQLRALYFDTPGRELVRARVALRLRLEGNQWVQTLKMPGEHSLSRIEINHVRADSTLDLSLYAGTPAAEVLATLSEPLQVCYETDVRRQLRDIRASGGTLELAFDRGWLRAGALQLPISELEFELKSGALSSVFDIGRQWQQKFGLILDFRSKAERGDLLAQLAQALDALALDASSDPAIEHQLTSQRAQRIAEFWAPRGAASLSLTETVQRRDPAQVLAAVTSECMEHIVRNAAILCEVDTAGICRASTPEHVHQLRVGIRRLRSAWSFFDGIAELPPLEHRQKISQYFTKLGGARDEDVLHDTVLPALYQAGMPYVMLPRSNDADTSTLIVASKDFQAWLLDMLAQCTIPLSRPAQTDSAPTFTTDDTNAIFSFPRAVQQPEEPALKPVLIAKLKKWHRQIIRSGLQFQSLEIEQQHALRKKTKRLRYALQFCESLLPEASLQRYRKQLASVQDILGEMNDLYVATPLFETLRVDQPHAWFASGWIQSRLATLTIEAQAAFKRLADTKPPWS